ncbi:MAG: 5'/3'-nucleotidase SurE [Candidatus Sumerlaeota bacterium]|nr:5'/3'-nucleotidase SurE [Candidatus Sumerlaeota bacterium]
MKRPRILLTNDDGIRAPGLAALAEAMEALGEIVIIAPSEEMSATGHAVSVNKLHTLQPVHRAGRLFGHAFDGWPADCVKFAIGRWLETPPDLVASGINLGPNLGTNVPYSGTVAAAVEAAMLGVPGIAVSTERPAPGRTADFGPAARIAAQLARDVLQRGIAPGVALNVNVPLVPESEIRGWRVAPQGCSRIRDLFEPAGEDEKGSPIWSNRGFEFLPSPNGGETDDWALAQGYVAITPIGYDMTAYGQMEEWRKRISGK